GYPIPLLSDIVNQENVNVLLIDDVAYSGNYIYSNIDESVHTLPKDKKELVSWYVCVGYITEDALDILNNLTLVLELTIFNLQGEKFKPKINVYYQEKLTYIDAEYSIWKSDADKATPIIFHHKIANQFGSFPQIYCHGYNPGNQ